MVRPFRVKLVLPALTEATSPYWRPIKYSLFPPLGLATLAAFLAPDDEAVLVDEHVQTLDIDDGPDLVLIQAYITNAYRAYRIADHYRARGAFVALGGLHVTSLPDEAALHADARSRYEAGLSRLEEDERLAIIGRLELGYTFAEVASLIDKRTPDAARKHTERALRRLAEQMCVARA